MRHFSRGGRSQSGPCDSYHAAWNLWPIINPHWTWDGLGFKSRWVSSKENHSGPGWKSTNYFVLHYFEQGVGPMKHLKTIRLTKDKVGFTKERTVLRLITSFTSLNLEEENGRLSPSDISMCCSSFGKRRCMFSNDHQCYADNRPARYSRIRWIHNSFACVHRI